MKAVELTEARGTLDEYARRARRETLVLMRGGKPVAAVVALDAADAYSASLTSNPDFIAIIERGRAQPEAKRSYSLSEMRRKHGLDQPKRPKARKTA